MLKYGGPAILDTLAGLVDTLWSTELVPGHWRAGDIVNIFKKGDIATGAACRTQHGRLPCKGNPCIAVR